MKSSFTLLLCVALTTQVWAEEDLTPKGPPSEAVDIATSLVDTLFHGNKVSCYALGRKLGSTKVDLLELDKPRTAFWTPAISKADAVAGVVETYGVSLTYDRVRVWDEKTITWSPWSPGDTMLGSQWILQRKSGGWGEVYRPYLNIFVMDGTELSSRVAKALGVTEPISADTAAQIFGAICLHGVSCKGARATTIVGTDILHIGQKTSIAVGAKTYSIACTDIDEAGAMFQIPGTSFTKRVDVHPLDVSPQITHITLWDDSKQQ